MAAQSALPSTSQNPRQVRWIEPNVQTIHNSTERQLNKIHDLCSVLSKSCPGCFGFLDDDDNRFILYPGSQDLPAAKESTVTLEKIMQSAHTLSRRKRYFLALTLASSYLQLGSTPWLDAPLKKEHIVFLHDPVDPESAVIDQPYICREMSAHNSTSSNENIVTLGIRLLELSAMQWSKAVGEEAGPEFAEAIDWCLHAKQASDGSWRKEIWSNVIVPLDACHKQVSQRVVVT
ncbi:hypothetical protein EJ04DRAFT_431637 [Polyplosphaeria fusca]|uniref:DUF7580 domain-containing protein n=1 Tax=Polyplosphaeria fusca TaxID=682080 RepID=A0A9P4R067_9PLEO|nr:hypothetical protein EJ04DRAFT_431637 [Polyplosphaeria fusca]